SEGRLVMDRNVLIPYALKQHRQANSSLKLFAIACFLLFTHIASGAEVVDRIPRVLERGPHHKVVEEWRQVAKGGKLVDQLVHYTEVKNGIHYMDNGEWRETEEKIEAHEGGEIGRAHV